MNHLLTTIRKNEKTPEKLDKPDKIRMMIQGREKLKQEKGERKEN